MEQARTVTVNNISYDTTQFSNEVQQAVQIYHAIALDLQKSQLEVMKCQAALKTIGDQVTAAVNQELEARSKTAANDETE